jgi:CheY-like chemotaxis protein
VQPAAAPALPAGAGPTVGQARLEAVWSPWTGQPASEPGVHDRLRGRKVLIVDDDVRNSFAISSILELYDMTVLHAADGRAGIDTLRSTEGIDIVLMDVMMPDMDGYSTIKMIRQVPERAQLPVIAVTARAMHGDREKSLAAGANDHVTKPVDAEKLLTCMERWIDQGPLPRASGS